MRLKIIVLLSFFTVGYTLAQQESSYNHFFYKPLLHNPSLAGVNNVTNVFLLGRYQWAGFDNAPSQNHLLFETVLKSKKVGLAAEIVTNKIGARNNTGLNLTYSYRSYLKRHSYISFGLTAGAINNSIDFSNTIIADNFDPLIGNVQESTIALNSNVGISYVDKHLQAGISLPNLVGKQTNFSQFSYKKEQQLLLHAKYKFFISESKDYSITPLMVTHISPNTPTLIEASIIGAWKDNFWTNLTFKSTQSIATTIGCSINKRYNLGYSYEMNVGELKGYNVNSHEVMLNVLFGRGIPKAGSNGTATIKLGLNGIIAEGLLKEAKKQLKNNSALRTKLLEVKEKLEAFKDTKFNDPSLAIEIRKTLKELALKIKTKEDPQVVLHGKIVLEGGLKLIKANFLNVFIVAIEPKTEKEIGTYLPHKRSGKFTVILEQGKSYIIEVHKNDYRTYRKLFKFKKLRSERNYEKKLTIQLRKSKKR